MTAIRKKLIEVALPLEAINKESAREKSIRHGHPSTLHLWWARRPLAACRAVLFASLIDDPDQEGVPEALLKRIDQLPAPERPREEWAKLSVADQRRERLFAFIEQLVKWENSNDERVIGTARELIQAATGGNPPPVLDPFCGGGSIPLEAQRLGLEAHASDLNPVAVLITKALIEIPPKFANMPPVNPVDRARTPGASWKGAAGLAADVRYYGQWMRDEAFSRIGHLYPKVKLPKEQGGGEATVIAWLWARTVKCPNPACGATMPLIRSFWLSTKPGRKAWVEPIVDRAAKTVQFEVRTGQGVPQQSSKTGRGANFRCLVCGVSANDGHIKSEGLAGRMSAQLMAVVGEGNNCRVYLPPTTDQGALARVTRPDGVPDQRLADDPRNIWCVQYGLTAFVDLFTPRQLVALTTLSDLVVEARERVRRDAREPDSGYADAVATYLALALSKLADASTSLTRWKPSMDQAIATFARQALPMVWDYAESNSFNSAAGDYQTTITTVARVIDNLATSGDHHIRQLDARTTTSGARHPIIATDPPYYDNVGYADLSDFFYVWLRRSLGGVYPELFSTMLVPKSEELVATPYRFGGSKEKAKGFFEEGLGTAFARMQEVQAPDYPTSVYYAFKQTESDGEGDSTAPGDQQGIASTGWETMLEALLRAGFSITGTWPMRSELANRMLASGTNALASSIVLVCRPRPANAVLTTRRDLIRALKAELPDALRKLQRGNIAPVDFAQAAIGPGMAVYSRYSKVLEPDGKPMSVRSALALINQALDEVLAEQEGEYDADTRWAVEWFSQHGQEEGPFGEADVLSRAKDTSVGGLVEAGFLSAKAGKVRLLARKELPADWDATTDKRLTVWEVTQQLIRALDEGGESAAAALLRQVGGLGDVARDLAYRLYTTCERKKWTQEALAYNSLVVAWPEIARLAAQQAGATSERLL